MENTERTDGEVILGNNGRAGIKPSERGSLNEGVGGEPWIFRYVWYDERGAAENCFRAERELARHAFQIKADPRLEPLLISVDEGEECEGAMA
jgi:hypothetical protein